MTWEEICADPSLRDLPYKFEQDRYGRVVMSPPPSTNHARYIGKIVGLLTLLMPDWSVLVDCGVQTTQNVRVPDVAVMPAAAARAFGGTLCLPRAPEICVEVLSPSNHPDEIEEKGRLYASAGCREFWVCSEDGVMSFRAADGSRLARSAICPAFPTIVALS